MATESNTKFYVTTGVTVALALCGYLYTWYHARQVALFQAQLERVNQQLRDFYGPLHALIESEDESYKAFIEAKRPGSAALLLNADVTDVGRQKELRRWIVEVTVPNYAAMEQVILRRSDLIIEPSMPKELIALQAHIAGYKPVVAAWKEGDYARHYSYFPFPQDARHYVRTRFATLKAQQERLLGRVGSAD